MILGDGSYVVTLEKRGYVKAGDWTPEAAVEVRINTHAYDIIYFFPSKQLSRHRLCYGITFVKPFEICLFSMLLQKDLRLPETKFSHSFALKA